MAIKHANPLDIIDVRPLGDNLRKTVTSSLLKASRLQVMRTVLLAGKSVPEHRVAGEMTLQCLEGEVVITTPTRTGKLAAGELMVLPGGEPHSLLATSDSTLLVTMLIHA